MKTFGTQFVAAAVIGLATIASTGCSSGKTEGDKTLDRAKIIEDAGNKIKMGEDMKRDGAALEARGKAAKAQGDTVNGEKMINEGEMKQKQGQMAIDQGKKMKM